MNKQQQAQQWLALTPQQKFDRVRRGLMSGLTGTQLMNDNKLPQWVRDVIEDHKAGHTIEDLHTILGRGGLSKAEIDDIIKKIPLE